MLKIEYVDCGSDIQVFLRSDSHEETEQNFWSMYHHRATEKEEPNWLDEFQCYFWTQKERLLKAFEGAALGYILNNYNEKFKGVRIDLEDNKLTVSSENPEQEKAKETIEIDGTGKTLSVGFNVSYLIDAISACEGELVNIGLNDENSSALITDPTDPNSKFVVMPMRL